MARLDAFAHDLFTIITVGNKGGDSIKASTEENHNPQFTSTATTVSALEGRH
jgi:biopolymer transport protein ExbB